MQNSKIEWCDHTFNPWEGCTKVSPGCLNCYAESRNSRWNGGTAPNWGKGAPRRRTSEALWKQPLKWNAAVKDKWEEHGCSKPGCGYPDGKPCTGCGLVVTRPRVFCASLADWLDDEVPIEWLADLLNLIRLTPNLDWLLLTKRPENWRVRIRGVIDHAAASRISEEEKHFILSWGEFDRPPANVWIGTSVEDQTRADERIPKLLQIPAKVRFLSCEPLLGPVDITTPLLKHKFAWCEGVGLSQSAMASRIDAMPWINWVIAGGESGHGARPMHPDWARSLRDQCQAAGVPFLFKQWGEWLPICENPPVWKPRPDGEDWHKGKASKVIQLDGREEVAFPPGAMTCIKIGKKEAGRLLDGVLHTEFPLPH
jgi:protein gp37